MSSVRLPESAEALLPFCRRHEDAFENACFDTYADMIVCIASCGFQRMHGRNPSEPSKFLSSTFPVDLAVFKNQGLFPNLLMIGLGSEGKSEIARDEDRLCRVIEAFADVGCKYLAFELRHWTPARFHLELSALLCRSVDDYNSGENLI
jgi:hypothetical protein